MFFKKNLPLWERIARFGAAIGMVAYGLIGFPALPIGYLIAGAGVFTALTAVVGFCPACAMVGRKLDSNS